MQKILIKTGWFPFALLALLCTTAALAAEERDSFGIAIETLAELLEGATPPLLIDIRSPEAFAQTQIPSSLNIAPFALKYKPFLQERAVVLVDEGYRPAHLEQLCRQLQEDGLEARYLYGGLNAWHAAEKPLQGDVFVWRELNRIPPQAVQLENFDTSWLLIDASEHAQLSTLEKRGEEETHPPAPSLEKRGGVFSCPFSGEGNTFRACVEDALETPAAASFRAVLVVNGQGGGYNDIQAILPQLLEGRPVWFLQGGLSAYRRQRTLQERIAEGRNHPETACTKPSGCVPCQKATAR